jgi:osmotically-inducible protein OsmY
MKTIIKVSAASFALVLLALPVRPVLAAQRPSDETITYWIKTALFEDPRVESADVKVATTDGIATLSGTVRNLAEKRYADLEAKKINGVRGVLNNLQVTPAYRSDTDITQEIRRRIISSPVIQSQNLEVSAVNGDVTLRGSAASYSESQQADLLASEVRGVKSVNNEIAVAFATNRPDTEVQSDIKAKLARDVYLVGLPINATVNGGLVTLAGQVGNAFQKERAQADALWIDNVRDVKNDLKVVWWEDQGERQKAPYPSDQDLAKAVHDELHQDLRVWDPWTIDVDAKYGHVTLRGTVPTYHQKNVADEDAKEVVGVAWVSNMIQVSPALRSDAAIEDDVRFSINSDYVLAGDDISVHVKDGVVTLAGTVNTTYEKSQATQDAAAVLGVADVVNNVDATWQPKYTDAALRERILNRLAANWETWPVAGQIAVVVDHGQVTLSGEVNTWPEYDEAGRVAFLTDGIWSVDNELTVAGVPYDWNTWHTALSGVHLYDPYCDRDYALYYQTYP